MHQLMIDWQSLALGMLAWVLFPLIVAKIAVSSERYRKKLGEDFQAAEREQRRLLTEEGVIYDRQLKLNEKLSEISGLYEITKDMSTSLRFIDIFGVLAGYLHKTFLFKRAWLVLIAPESGDVTGDAVYETAGVEDRTLRAKGIIPKMEIMSRQPDAHDKKVYGLLKDRAKRIQIVDRRIKEDPYLEYLPDKAKSFMAIPVIIDGRLAGILAIENLAASEFGKFSILAAQFSLEMKRIILYEKVEQMAITDGLTKSFAKRHITERLGEEFERSVKHEFSLAFLMIDIDHFKNYNDTYGHLVGDAVLRDIVALLKANTREVDLVGRFGGEEFCIILPETNKDEAMLVAERIREMIEKHEFKAYDESTKVTVSIGVAIYPQHAKDAGELIDNSDKALYRAKTDGRNRVRLFH